jgi:phosphoribosylanthranilate isomerase
MGTIVKICGLTTIDAVDAALGAGADMVGFVLFDRSPRHVSLDRAANLGARVGRGAAKVLLTVDADDASLAAAIAALDPALLQLHGSEPPARVAGIRAAFGLRVIKAIAIGASADRDQIRLYDDVADMLLFDARPPADATRPGGNGAGFDWSLLAGLKAKKPWLLAGGLDAGNVARALRETGAPGVDVSSGVESAPGIKDTGKITEFVALVRAVRAEKFGLARANV